jgi:hypothetical protein
VLLYRRGQTVIHCPEPDISERAAGLLSALAGPALNLVLTAAPGAAAQEPNVTVIRKDHAQLPADDLHIASAEVRGRTITFTVCQNLISAGLADALGLLCTAHARELLQLGRPCPEMLAVTGR